METIIEILDDVKENYKFEQCQLCESYNIVESSEEYDCQECGTTAVVSNNIG